jgi:carbon-monoxide dehydrogenase medium subunit
MMRFEYLEPNTVDEALSLLGTYDGKAMVIAGGTDVLRQIRDKVIQPEFVIDISGIPGLDLMNYNKGVGMRIGATTTIRSLENATVLQTRYPILSQAARQLGSVAIRNVATLGGNLCNARPSADMAPALLGLNARVKLIGPGRERVVPLEDFFTGPGKTILDRRELMVEVQLPVEQPNTKGIYLKHSIRGSIELAIVGVAAIVALEGKVCRDIRLVLGAVAPTPIRAKRAEEIIRGARIDDALIDEAARVASDESRPISDVRASAEYRKEMVRVLTKRAINEAVCQCKNT